MRMNPIEAVRQAIVNLEMPIPERDAATVISYAIHLMLNSDNCGASLYDMTGDIKDFNTVIYNRRDFYQLQKDAELGNTAMRFVDRAGDVAPGIDDAETICEDFYTAMTEVLDRQWNRK